MKNPINIFILIIFSFISVAGAGLNSTSDLQQMKLRIMKDFNNKFELACYAEPCFISGDFDGDNKLDTAVLVNVTSNKKRGIAFLHADGKSIIVGPGNPIGNGKDDYSWMDFWSLYKRKEAPQGASDIPPPKLRGDALSVVKKQSASAIIYWDGSSYQWYQQGD
jgi:hypothetical protein